MERFKMPEYEIIEIAAMECARYYFTCWQRVLQRHSHNNTPRYAFIHSVSGIINDELICDILNINRERLNRLRYIAKKLHTKSSDFRTITELIITKINDRKKLYTP